MQLQRSFRASAGRRRVASFVLGGLIASALLIGGAVTPAFATATITHVPPATAVGSGADLALDFLVTDPCTFICPHNVYAKLCYDAPWGQSLWVRSESWDMTSSNFRHNVHLTIPANAIRYPSMTYRLIYYDVNGGQRGYGGDYTVSVANQITANAVTDTGGTMSNGAYSVWLIDSSTAPNGFTQVASGSTSATGSMTLTVPNTAAVLQAAAANDGFANFIVEMYATVGLTDYAAVGGFYANFANTREFANTAGISLPLNATLIGAPEPAATCTPGNSYQEALPSQWVDSADVHAVYGVTTVYSYGTTGDTDMEFAFNIGSGWERSGDMRTHAGNATSVQTGAVVYPHETPSEKYESRAEVIQILHAFQHEHVESYDIAGKCHKHDVVHDTGWAGHIDSIRTRPGSIAIGIHPDDCQLQCTLSPHTAAHIEKNKTFSTLFEKNYDFQASVCLTVACLTARSGYSQFSSLEMTMTSVCDWYWVYGNGAEDPSNAARKYVDAGDPEDTFVGGAPSGCRTS